jgi:prepilin-type N-terminal cleavage/methylation domain-containing protein
MKQKIKQKNNLGFTPFRDPIVLSFDTANIDSSKVGKKTNDRESLTGFTLIELLVVIAVIGLLASITLIALTDARQKSRNTKRLADMVQMNNGLELYNAYFKGYPASASGTPSGLNSQFMSFIPQDPAPGDGVCDLSIFFPSGGPGQPPANTPIGYYYYVPVGAPYLINGTNVYGTYNYYFCLGSDTGNFKAGPHIMTPAGVQ